MNFLLEKIYSHLIKVELQKKLKKFEKKKKKAIKDQGIKLVEAIKALKPEENQKLEPVEGIFPKNPKNNETKNETDDIKNGEKVNELTQYLQQTNINMIFNNMKQ